MSTFAVEKARAIAQGDQDVVNGFSGSVRSLESNTFEPEDLIIFPKTYTIKKNCLNPTAAEKDRRWLEYCFVGIVHKDGTKTIRKFYPTTFTKYRIAVNADASPITTGDAVRRQKGTAVDEFQKHGTIPEAMAAFNGKVVKVSAVEEINVLKYGSLTDVQHTQMCQLDLQEAPATEEQLKMFEE